MKSQNKSRYFLKPILGLLLLFASVSFQPYSQGSVAAIAQTEWLGEGSSAKKGKVLSFFTFFSGAIPDKSSYTTSNFSAMLRSQEKDLQLTRTLQNFKYSVYKITLQKCLFRAAVKISAEVPLFSEPV